LENKKHQNILSYIWSLKERVEKLYKEANYWEVRPRISKKIEKIDTRSKVLRQIMRLALKSKLNKKEKKQLIRLTKTRLASLIKHFLSVYSIVQKNPSRIWDKKIKVTEKNLAESLTLYEKIVPLLFQKKFKKPKRKK